MNSLNSNQFEKSIKKNKIFLIVSLIFLLLTIGLIYLGYKNENQKLPEAVNMNSLIADYSKEENKYAYIDVNTKPYLFAVYETDGIEDINKFYLVMDKENYLYIVYMSTDNYDKLNVDTIPENPIRVNGITRKIEDDIKNLAISSYNELLEDEYLTDENFEDYVGLIYLDIEASLYDSTVYYVGAFVSFLFFIVFIIVYLSVYFKNRKIFKKFSQEELERISLEIYSQKDSNPYEKMKLYFLKDYIVDTANSVVIVKYGDIVWAYPYEYRYNGLLVNKNIKVMTTDSKIHDISNTKFLDKRKDETIQEILSKLKEKNPDILIGFNKENKKLVKEKLKK